MMSAFRFVVIFLVLLCIALPITMIHMVEPALVDIAGRTFWLATYDAFGVTGTDGLLFSPKATPEYQAWLHASAIKGWQLFWQFCIDRRDR